MFSEKIENKVRKIIRRVKDEGDKAVLYWTEKFDQIKLKPNKLKIRPAEISRADKTVDAKFLRALRRAKKNIWQFHQKQLTPLKRNRLAKKNGVMLGERYQPIESVGIYVPGGRASYPSTVLMAAVPARVVGVKRIVMVSPPPISKWTLTAAKICGIKEIYQVGGAQAIAALAYGTRTIPKVDKIVGPGNVWVQCAKKLVFGEVGIDLLAGPSEVAILADSSANPEWVAQDLLAQLEHGAEAKAILLSTSGELLQKVRSFCRGGRHPFRTPKVLQCPRGSGRPLLIKVHSLQRGIEIVNQIAPEHLEILTRNARGVVKKIKNAGAIFPGDYSPVSLGDYYAGPSHILPTGGTVRFASGLSVNDFLHRQSIISYSKDALRKAGPNIVKLAESEGMPQHAGSVKMRFKQKK